MMRVVVREDFSRSRCDALVTDLQMAVNELKKMDEKQLEQHKEHAKLKGQRHAQRNKTNSHFKDEEHSLKGKHGKTHAVC